MRTGQVFAEALRAGDAAAVRRVPKTDLHAHAYLSARIETLERQLDHALLRPPHRMNGLAGMREFVMSAVNPDFNTREGAELVATAAVADAIDDGVSILEMSFDVLTAPHYPDGLHGFLGCLRSLVEQCRDHILLRPELGISRRYVGNAALMDLAPEAIVSGVFTSIDLYDVEDACAPEDCAVALRAGARAGAHAQGARRRVRQCRETFAERSRYWISTKCSTESPPPSPPMSCGGSPKRVCDSTSVRPATSC